MNKIERIISSIKLKTVDKIPTSYRGVECLSKSLMKYFNIKGEGFLNNEENRDILLERLGADIWSDTVRIDKFNNFHPMYNGSSPEPPYANDGSLFYTLGIKSRSTRIEKYNYEYSYITKSPLKKISTISELKKNSLISRLDLFDFETMVNGVTGEEFDKRKNRDFISMGSLNNFFMICCYLRGMEQFLSDLAFNKKLAEYIINEVGEFCLEFNKRELLSFGRNAEFYCCWDDLAGQYGLMISPEVFKKYFLPLYRRLIDNVKKYNLFFSWHCCGSIHKILPHMIDAGIDVFEVCQTSAKDMELEKVYKLYGNNVCIHGGIDVQDLLIRKKPKDIKEEVKKIIDLWGHKGGMMIAPSHEALPETPIENILAIYEQVNNQMK
jgi:uroporphyrinogen decarboxylase